MTNAKLRQIARKIIAPLRLLQRCISSAAALAAASATMNRT
jgi:hypothetical protein